MIGTGAIVMNVFMVTLGLFLFLGALSDLIWRRRSRPRNIFDKRDYVQASGWAGVGISALFLFAVCGLFIREVHLHSDLSRLQAEKIKSIVVGAQSVNDPERVREIIDILSRPQWFNMSRGDAGDKVPFVLIFKDGTERQFLITRYQRGAGAALQSVSPFGWENGEALYPQLNTALLHSGIKLPECLTFQGKPVHCPPFPENR